MPDALSAAALWPWMTLTVRGNHDRADKPCPRLPRRQSADFRGRQHALEGSEEPDELSVARRTLERLLDGNVVVDKLPPDGKTKQKLS